MATGHRAPARREASLRAARRGVTLEQAGFNRPCPSDGAVRCFAISTAGTSSLSPSAVGRGEPTSLSCPRHHPCLLYTSLGERARFLLGFDTCRDKARLIPAYDDPAGVTARFNRNLLVRLNREAGADFDPEDFAHRAVWNPGESRIEMHLVSRGARTVTVAGRKVRFAKNETIHTENSYKYAPDRMRAMIGAAGWSVAKTWSDSKGLFALWLLD